MSCHNKPYWLSASSAQRFELGDPCIAYERSPSPSELWWSPPQLSHVRLRATAPQLTYNNHYCGRREHGPRELKSRASPRLTLHLAPPKKCVRSLSLRSRVTTGSHFLCTRPSAKLLFCVNAPPTVILRHLRQLIRSPWKFRPEVSTRDQIECLETNYWKY